LFLFSITVRQIYLFAFAFLPRGYKKQINSLTYIKASTVYFFYTPWPFSYADLVT